MSKVIITTHRGIINGVFCEDKKDIEILDMDAMDDMDGQVKLFLEMEKMEGIVICPYCGKLIADRTVGCDCLTKRAEIKKEMED